VEPEPAEHACDVCGYRVIEFRPLDHCPMCGAVAAALLPAALVVAAPAA
jgi:rubrerythrin